MAASLGGSSIRTAALALAATTLGIGVLIVAATLPPPAKAQKAELTEFCSSVEAWRCGAFIAEGLKRVWDRCWRRRNGVWVSPHGRCGKLKNRWAGPGRIGTPPADAGPIVWGEGDFHATG
jgi:hypothetical protein